MDGVREPIIGDFDLDSSITLPFILFYFIYFGVHVFLQELYSKIIKIVRYRMNRNNSNIYLILYSFIL